MFAYLMALNKERLEERIKDPEVIRDLASRAFEIPLRNTVFDSVTNHIFVKDVKGSAFASIFLETGDVTLSNSFYSKQADRFARMYEKEGNRKISIDKKY